MKKLYRITAILLLLLTLTSLSAQQAAKEVTIRGAVIDAGDEPVVGAHIMLEGSTSKGTVSDVDGKFSISAKVGDIFNVTSLGFDKNQFSVNNRTEYTVRLTSEDVSLDEVVVVGYGTQRRVDLTGAVTTVSSDDMKSTVSSDLANSLTGRAPGVRVAQYSSEPGEFDTDIDIRGFGEPLYIIDGMERSKDEFSRLTAAEIDNLSVLKDASAAIYGVKAANGVVLVTTKQGEAQRAKVNYSGKFGISKITEFIEVCDAYQYATLWNEKNLNSQINSTYKPVKYSDSFLEQLQTGEIESTDYLDLIFDNFAFQQTHNISVSGGTDNIKYFISAGYFQEEGLFSSGDLNSNKVNLRSNFNVKLRPNLKLTVNLGYINSKKNGLSESMEEIFDTAVNYNPIGSPYADGDSSKLKLGEFGVQNPLAMIDSDISGYDNDDDKFLQSQFRLDWTVSQVKGLAFQAAFAYDQINKYSEVYNRPYTLYEYNDDTEDYTERTYNGPDATLEEHTTDKIKTNLRIGSTYYKNINKKHKIDAMLAYEQRYEQTETRDYSATVLMDNVDDIGAGEAMTAIIESSYTELARMSVIGRLNYGYTTRYLLSGTIRADGSSKFAAGNRWGYFPSVSGAWRLSEEKFVKGKTNWINNIKLRASWGIMGDDSAQDNQDVEGYEYPGSYYKFGDTWVTGYDVTDLANEYLTWYTSRTYNIGVDVSLWKDKLYFTIEYFNRFRTGLLTTQTAIVPTYIGADLPQVNANEDITSGLEVILGHRGTAGKVRYSVEGNVSYTRTKYGERQEVASTNSLEDYYSMTSYRYGDIVWGYETDGVYTSFAEIAAGAIVDGQGNKTVFPGSPKFVDQNGDGVIDTNDMVALGSGGLNKPLLYFGLNIDLSYKNFDFKMLWQGGAKNLVRYNSSALRQPFADDTSNPIVDFFDRWHCIDYDNPREDSSWVSGAYPPTGYVNAKYYLSDQVYFEANYLRLKNVELGYTLPKAITRKVGLDACRLYINTFNLLTFQSGYDFLDPETNSGRNYSYPVTYSINVGVDLTF